MRDDFLSREFVDARPSMTESIRALLAATGNAFARLNAARFDAPWRPSRRPTTSRCG